MKKILSTILLVAMATNSLATEGCRDAYSAALLALSMDAEGHKNARDTALGVSIGSFAGGGALAIGGILTGQATKNNTLVYSSLALGYLSTAISLLAGVVYVHQDGEAKKISPKMEDYLKVTSLYLAAKDTANAESRSYIQTTLHFSEMTDQTLKEKYTDLLSKKIVEGYESGRFCKKNAVLSFGYVLDDIYTQMEYDLILEEGAL